MLGYKQIVLSLYRIVAKNLVESDTSSNHFSTGSEEHVPCKVFGYTRL